MKKAFGYIYRYLFLSDYRVQYRVNFLVRLSKRKKMRLLCFLMRENLRAKRYVIISKNAEIGSIRLMHPHNVVIGDYTVIGNGCTIYHDVTFGQNRGKFPVVGDNVVVYTGAKIVGDVHIGNNAVIGANAVVTSDVPENAIVGGIPAKVLKYREVGDEFN